MYNKAKNEAWEEFKAFKIVKKEQESSVITSFYLEASDGKPVPNFQAGQYITIRLSIPGEEYLLNRQYSLSDSPGKQTLRISVKKETGENIDQNGKVSNYLHDSVNVGDKVEMTAPAGDFVLDGSANSPLYLISGGVGITPMLSMLKTVGDNQPSRMVTFIQAANDGNVQAFGQEVSETVQSMPNAKKYVILQQPTASDREENKFDFEGYLDLQKLEQLVKEKDATFYVCGPAPFMGSVIENLQRLGVKSENINYEFFGPAIDLKQYQEA